MTNPTVGQKGRRETAEELRLEIICPGARLAAVLKAIRARHSYEEPAIDVYPLHNAVSRSGSGRVGHYGEARSFRSSPSSSRGLLATSRADGRRSQEADPARGRRVWSGDDFLGDAMQAGADVLLTGEARFHRALEAESLDIGLVLAGHHATEPRAWRSWPNASPVPFLI